MTEKEIFELFDLYGTDMGDYYEIEVGRIERLVKEIEFQSAPKELSDEEIHDIWKSLWEGGNIGHIAYNYARAIEERHGIK